jgi:hypothetical protein
MNVTRWTLLKSKTLQIGFVRGRDVSEKCGELEWQNRNVAVLPYSGLFFKAGRARRHVIRTPSHREQEGL